MSKMNSIRKETNKGRIIMEEKEFPEDLEGRLSSVLNAVNTEFKTVTLLHLDDSPAEGLEIRDRIRDIRGRGYLPQARNFDACGETLHDIALVARQTVVRDDGKTQVLGYSLTEAGKKYGLPIAEHVLKWVVDNGLSMYQILGCTNSSSKKRSPSGRIGILEALSTGKASETELADFLDLAHEVIAQHLRQFSKIGFIEFDSIGAKSKGFSKYVWVEDKSPENVRTVKKLVALTKKTAEEMFKEGEFDCNSLAKRIQYRHITHLSSVLADLERQGFLRRTALYLEGSSRSEARILKLGQKFLEEVIYPVKEHLTDDIVLEIDFGERGSEYVARGIDIYARVSPNINKRPPSERVRQVRGYLLKNPGATSREISKEIGLIPGSVRVYLRQLNSLRTEKEGHEVRYFLDDKKEC